MNILFLIGSYDSFGGTEKITTVLANAFAAQGHRVCIAACRGKCEPEKLGLAAAVRCFPLAHDDLRRVLIDEKIEVVVNQWCLPFYVTRQINRARRGLNVRLVSVLHGVPDRSKKVIVAEDAFRRARGFMRVVAWLRLRMLNAVIKASIRYVYRQSDAYVVLSKSFIPALKSYAGIKSAPKLHAIGNPITIATDYATDWSARKKKQILYVGRMDKENKRVNRIVEAWQRVWCDYPDWQLVLVGDGPHLRELKDYVATQGVERVTFTGFLREDPIEYYKDSSIFMLTSDLEGFGLVLVEAMAYGVVPVVYGSYLSVRDIIDDGANGLITPVPYSEDATVAAMRMLMDDESRRVRLSVAAQEKSKSFALERILRQWSDLLSADQ